MVLHRFPGINRVCKGFGLDITKDRVPVRPGAHYMVGGVTVDTNGRTTLPGLWAAGEVTSSGLHGANRLASNSLIEGLVYGSLCGRGASEAARSCSRDLVALPIRQAIAPPDPTDRLDVADLTASLAEPDGAQDGNRPRTVAASGSAARRGLLVPLRAHSRVRHAQPGGSCRTCSRSPG